MVYTWLKGSETLFSGTLYTHAGGAPVDIPSFTISSLKVGTHTLALQANDGINKPVTKKIKNSIIDIIAPSLAPVADNMILWPSDRQMVSVTIQANANDNSGNSVRLAVAVACNESVDGTVY